MILKQTETTTIIYIKTKHNKASGVIQSFDVRTLNTLEGPMLNPFLTLQVQSNLNLT